MNNEDKPMYILYIIYTEDNFKKILGVYDDISIMESDIKRYIQRTRTEDVNYVTIIEQDDTITMMNVEDDLLSFKISHIKCELNKPFSEILKDN